MNREDDQQLWDLLGRSAEPRVSPFFARNVLRQIRQEPRSRSWFRPTVLIPAFGAAVAVVVATAYFRNSEDSVRAKPAPVIAKQDVLKPVPQPTTQIGESQPTTQAVDREPTTQIAEPVAEATSAPMAEPEETEPAAVAQIDPQDYDVVANLDDLLVLYETSVWDENSSL